jgi:RNA polymerase subunit RPABC4/transcription elongation factor Spt4
MSKFRNELRVIPRAAWVTAMVLYLLMACVLSVAFRMSDDAGLREMPAVIVILLPFLVSLFIFIPVGLLGYVYGDAKRRGMRYVLWTLLAIFIPNAIGLILYFILRDPLPKPCPSCGTLVKAGFAYCPKCGTETSKACPACRRAIEPEWMNCAYCGKKIAAGPTEAA